MKEKVELVLNGLIEVYIKKCEPLSSTRLKEFANLPFSPSSIRSYLKELEEYDLIEKEHFSSGSYPSVKAMKRFWQDNLEKRIIDLDKDLAQTANIHDIYIMIEVFENQLLIDVYNLNNKFIVLEFEKDEVVFKYDDNLFTFFNSVKGMLLDELKKYLYHVNLDEEYNKIYSLYQEMSFNKGFLYKNSLDMFENKKNSKLPHGINFKDEFLIMRNIQNRKNKFYDAVVIGHVYTDFFQITKPVKGGRL